MGISKDVTARELVGLTSVSSAPGLPYTVPIGDRFQELFGIGRTTQWQLIEHGEVESILVSVPGRGRSNASRGRRVIVVSSYLAYLERQKQREAAGEIGMTSPNPRARRGEGPTPQVSPRTVRHPQRSGEPNQRYRTARSR